MYTTKIVDDWTYCFQWIYGGSYQQLLNHGVNAGARLEPPFSENANTDRYYWGGNVTECIPLTKWWWDMDGEP